VAYSQQTPRDLGKSKLSRENPISYETVTLEIPCLYSSAISLGCFHCLTWKNTASPCLQTGQRNALLRGRVGSEVTSWSTWVLSLQVVERWKKLVHMKEERF
jgi:hypothetical protein